MGLPSIIGQCPDCCECPAPAIEWESRSASQTKHGFYEWPEATPSVPPKIYSEVTWAGTFGGIEYANECDCAYNGRSWTVGGSGRARRDVGGCDESSTLTVTSTTQYYYPCNEPNGPEVVTTTNYFPAITDCSGGTYVYGGPGEARRPTGADFYMSDITPTVRKTVPLTCDLPGPPGGSGQSYTLSGEITNTLSDEYTTAQLLANTIAALPSWDNDWNDTSGSYFNLTSNELTNSIREGKYRFRFKLPKVGAGKCYRIEWVERFTPETGDPVDTDKDWQWDGVTPEGYDPDDAETWPTSEEFLVAIPETNGTITVVDVVATCRGCVEV